ncbi:conserved hypothetical protein [Echinococcus multilocularis]|uniref:Uncharacterized protein n=1 Tax=Echinococcus multilocularis TaxID=6211 RepID=A0A068XZV5_ECHMU|nr:conserved hypothetical protein [Echinococcus multilocularis]
MTQLPVGKYWCFAENAHLVEDTYLLAPTDDITTERLRYTLQYGLLILPPVFSLLVICNSVAILRDCICDHCLNGPYLVAYCLLKLMAAALLWIMALPRFMQISSTTDAGRRVSAKIPTLIMTQQAFRLAATWLLFFLLVFQIFAVARLTRSITSKCTIAPQFNAIHTNLRSCKCITSVFHVLTDKTFQLFCTEQPTPATQLEERSFRRTYGHSILCIICIVVFSALLTAPQIGNFRIENGGDSLKWCVTNSLGSSAYEYMQSFLAFMSPAVCFLVLLLTMSCRLVKVGQKPHHHLHCLCHVPAENTEKSDDNSGQVLMWECKFIALISLVEFVSWLPVNAQINLHRLGWIRNDGRGINVWILCEIALLTGDVLVQIILFAKILFESAICCRGKRVDTTDAQADTSDLHTSRHYTPEDTEYAADSLVPLYSLQIDSQQLAKRKSILHVRMSPPPLPSPDYTYGALKMSGQEDMDSALPKLSCFQREYANNTTPTPTNTTTSPTTNANLLFFCAFPDHEDYRQSQFTTTEEYVDSHGVLVSRL